MDIDKIAKVLGAGKEVKTSNGFLTICPCHDDTNPSLSIKLSRNNGVIFNCHAGCSWKEVQDIVGSMGLLPTNSPKKYNNLPKFIWEQSSENNQEVEKYFVSRNISLKKLPECFRFNKYKGKMIVAHVSKPGDKEVSAIHRTFLDKNGQKTGRKMLGPCKGGAVWLSPPSGRMVVGEGIETTLSVIAATNLPGVACLSASGMKSVELPNLVKEIIIAVDSDPNNTGQNAARSLGEKFSGTTMYATPDESCFTSTPNKLDFNDLSQDQIRERFSTLLNWDDVRSLEGQQEISLFDEEGRPKTKATVLIEIGSQYELFRDETGDGYATISTDGHKETWPIKSKVFTELLADQYFLLSSMGVSRNIIADSTDTLRGMARLRGEQHKVYRRVAALNGKIYIDLCDEQWRVVEVTKDSWQLTTDCPVKFIRSPSSMPLPVPEKNGSLKDLWSLMNIKPEERSLVAGFLIRALSPRSPYFNLGIVGEQGTGKSSFATLVRSLCDPSTAMLRPPPKDERDFLAGAVNNWCITYDNLSGMQPWLSDSLCRMLTGGSFAARTLYSTTEETTIPLARPTILNGIDDLTSRPDLADRSIVITLQPISDDDRLEERELWGKFEAVKGKIFGVLLDGISSSLRNIDKVTLPTKPRMVDAARWGAAAEEGLDIPQGSFIESYMNNQREMVSVSLEASPFIAALLDMINDLSEWSGTPSELLAFLPKYARDEESVRSKAWPKSPPWTTKTLRRYSPALRKIGIQFEHTRKSTSSYLKFSMQVKDKKLTPHSQMIDEGSIDSRDVQMSKSTYTTYTTAIKPEVDVGNVGNVSKIPDMSVESTANWEEI